MVSQYQVPFIVSIGNVYSNDLGVREEESNIY